MKRLARGAGATMALALGAWVGWQLWPQLRALQSRPRPTPTSPAPVLARGPTQAPGEKVSVLGTDASLSPGPLKLILVSTAPKPTLADSTAALGTDPRNPQTYAGGAVLSNGARIVDIRHDRIVLSMRGQKTTLAVEPTSAVPDGNAGEAGSVGAMSGQQANVPPGVSSREDLSEFLRPQPEYENGRLSGLRIFAGTNASRLASLGLEAGDVIRAVSGAPVTSERAWQEVDDILSSGGSLVVEVERKGTRLSVSLDGARLAGGEPAT